MKRFIVTAVISSLISGAAFAQATNVVSSANIVGYVQTTTPASNKTDIVSLAQFSTGSNSVTLQSLFANRDDLRSGTNIALVDKVITWNGSAYVKYGLYKNATVGPFWMVDGSGWTVPAFPKTATVVNLARGTAAWFQSATVPTTTNVVASGNVFLDGNYSVKMAGTTMLLSYPYSADINLNQLVVTNAYSGTNIALVDKIITWNGSAYVKYGLYKNATVGPFWMVDGSAWTVPAFPKTATSVQVNLGKGFWYQSTNSTKTIGFSCIYTNLL